MNNNEYLPFGKAPDGDCKVTIPLARYNQLLKAEIAMQAIMMADDQKKDSWDRHNAACHVLDALYPKPDEEQGGGEDAECGGDNGSADS